MQWRAGEDLFKGLGDNLYSFNAIVPPLAGNITWVQPAQDAAYLMAKLLSPKEEQIPVIDQDFQAGFNRFLAFEMINLFQATQFDPALTPKLLNNQELPTEAALCLDISYKIGPAKTFYGRLILSQEFRKSWKERYAQRSLSVPAPLLEKIETTLHFEAGRTSISPSAWREVKPGDFLILDSCSLELDNEKRRRIMITVDHIPLFRGKIKDGNIKILEHPSYYEVDTVMNKNPDDEFEDNTEEESDFETEEEETDEEFTDDDTETETETEEDESESEEEEEFTDDGEEELSTEEHETEESQGAPAPGKSAPKEKAQAKPINPDEIPLNIVVEVGRLQMTIKKLMELAPGNILELDVHPEDGVDLIVNNKCIAKGELLKIGDALGVRILEKG